MKNRSIAVRVAAVCMVVAGVVAVVGGLVSARLVSSTAREVSTRTLSDQADVVAAQLSDRLVALPRLRQILAGQGVELVVARPGGQLFGGSAEARDTARAAGLSPDSPVGGRVVGEGGRAVLVQVRPIEGRGALALVWAAGPARGVGRTLVGNIALALGIGLLVAGVAALVLARFLSRPLARTAAVAAAMGEGRRDLRAPVEGPREVAEVAAAVNGLADALARSEGRQREFLLSVSHELRTPLTAVKGFAESLADGVVTGEGAAAAGRTIEAEADRLDRLVADLLDLARLGADDFRLDLVDVDLTALLADAATVWRARCADEDVPLTLHAPDAPVPLTTDPRRLRQVVDGLAENALRATPPGRPVVLALRAEHGTAVLEVRDGGPGLAPEDYPVAFERKALNAKYAPHRPVGTGIGLALAHALVTRLGGTLTATPAPEGGARFTVRLPARTA